MWTAQRIEKRSALEGGMWWREADDGKTLTGMLM